MENDNQSFAFLATESSKKFFAEADLALKSGRHIQMATDIKLWEFIGDNFQSLQYYYDTLYDVLLTEAFNDREKYYYLEFKEDSRGKLGKSSRELDDKYLIFGILLLNIFKEKFFEKKEVKWEELEQLFDESEHKEYWQKLFYGKNHPTVTEVEDRKQKVRGLVTEFERIGWTVWLDKDEIIFEIMPSIDRLQRLYANEINNIERLEDYIDEQLS